MTVRGWLTKVLDLCDEGAKLDLDVRLFSYPRRIRERSAPEVRNSSKGHEYIIAAAP